MTEQATVDDRGIHAAVRDVIDRLIDFDEEARRRILRTAGTFFDMAPSQPEGGFADRPELSPKDFLFQKNPQTGVERVACLAHYLTFYRNTRHFKTIDISTLNTEAAQVKFSNTAYAVANAMGARLLVPAGKGLKQLSTLGERFVDALPDRAAVKEVLSGKRPRRRRKAGKGNGRTLELARNREPDN